MTQMTIGIMIKKKKAPVGIVLPEDGLYIQFPHDFIWTSDKKPRVLSREFPRFQGRAGAPEMVPLLLGVYCDLTEGWQWYWCRQLIFEAFGHYDETRLNRDEMNFIKAWFSYLTTSSRAFTNSKGTDSMKINGVLWEGRNYITKERLKKKIPGQEPLVCGGDIGRLVDHRIYTKRNVDYYKFEMLDGSLPPPDIEIVNQASHPWLWGKATISTPYGYDHLPSKNGPWRVDPFPIPKPYNGAGFDALFPFRTHGKKEKSGYTRNGVHYAYNYVEVKRVKKLPAGTQVIPSPYIP